MGKVGKSQENRNTENYYSIFNSTKWLDQFYKLYLKELGEA